MRSGYFALALLVTHGGSWEPFWGPLVDVRQRWHRLYREWLAGRPQLAGSEDYQVGFRLARAAGLEQIELADADTRFGYQAVKDFAATHNQQSLLTRSEQLFFDYDRDFQKIRQQGSVDDFFRYVNTPTTIALVNAPYTYLAQIGDASNFIGADQVDLWYTRNARIFAQNARLAVPNARIVVLYGVRHAFYFRQFVEGRPD